MALDIAGFIDDKKGHDIQILDVRHLSSIADFFVIATGNSNTHVNAIAEGVIDELREKGISLGHKEGQRGGNWILLDYLDIIVHVFTSAERDFYDIERIWSDAEKLELNIDTF
ncbi:Protein Iojap/ribosomal silencing factor RsfS like protein [Aduncisulcus paluster]|uniref:Protein Iojap/ribosomal silencing factor RsfS like protein n=1 Tax=Aduncisulcus paluster TaxID=2918883 RepID=A0ABQ5KM93_9EUKA|nr:Protein Iojap/ribosomal silencing factor RsfS like protein [Aduncisulcus paluster]